MLVQFFLERYCHELKRPPMGILPETLTRLQRYDWPGNVRELENVIERAVALASGPDIEPSDLSLTLSDSETETDVEYPRHALPFHASVEAYKRDLICHAIKQTGGNKTKAAQLLKLQPTYLWRLCKVHPNCSAMPGCLPRGRRHRKASQISVRVTAIS